MEENQNEIQKLSFGFLNFSDHATYNVKTGKYTHETKSYSYIDGPQEISTALNDKIVIWNKNQCWPWPTKEEV